MSDGKLSNKTTMGSDETAEETVQTATHTLLDDGEDEEVLRVTSAFSRGAFIVAGTLLLLACVLGFWLLSGAPYSGSDSKETTGSASTIDVVDEVETVVSDDETGETADAEEDGDGDIEESAASPKKSGFKPSDILSQAAKPIIYLYPEEETEVSVRLAHPERLTTSYPAYGDGWNVTARLGGMLSDPQTGRSLYALYYESVLPDAERPNEGFVVAKEDVVPFLEDALARIGLTEREAEEMIVYWLPEMSESKWCYIRFSLTEDEQETDELIVTPTPDHLIRVRMEWKGLDEPMSGVSEQRLSSVDRSSLDGFVVVEWGGTRLP